MLSKLLVTLILLVGLFSISTSAAPNFQTAINEVNREETSTISKQITTNELFDNKTVLTLNISSVPVVTTTVTNVLNSTDTFITGAGKNVNGKVVYTTSYYGSSSSSSDSGLSGGAIAGIVIGVIVLLCCCGALGCFKKSGHVETRQVWVEH